jgi:hypothetical protein
VLIALLLPSMFVLMPCSHTVDPPLGRFETYV